MTQADADVLVVGAGLAGLQVATRLAERGHDVMLIERRQSLETAVRTTGIFVRRTLDDFDLPADSLGPPIRRVVLYPPGLQRPVELISDRDEFRVGDMAGLYRSHAERAVEAGVRMLLRTRYIGRQADRHVIDQAGVLGSVRATYVVGADGARSSVARSLGLDRNRRLLIGAEDVFSHPGGAGEEPTFHCVLDPVLAPGYLAWVVDDGDHVHVGTAGYASRYPRGVRAAMREFAASAPGLERIAIPDDVEHRAGPIPVGGLLRRISCADGLLVGDAAGAVSPLTAGGLDPCLRQARHAAEVLDEALRTSDPAALARYDGATLRARFRGRITLRHALSLVRGRAVARAAFVGLRTTPGRAAARSILFSDRSFPDPTAPDPPTSRTVRSAASRR